MNQNSVVYKIGEGVKKKQKLHKLFVLESSHPESDVCLYQKISLIGQLGGKIKNFFLLFGPNLSYCQSKPGYYGLPIFGAGGKGITSIFDDVRCLLPLLSSLPK